MPSEYHPQHCRCPDCRQSADRPWPVEIGLALAMIGLLCGFSIGLVKVLELISGAAQ